MNMQKIIKTEEDYNLALNRIEKLMDASPETSEFDELELLSTLVEIYEDKHYPISMPSPSIAIKFRMEQQKRGRQFNIIKGAEHPEEFNPEYKELREKIVRIIADAKMITTVNHICQKHADKILVLIKEAGYLKVSEKPTQIKCQGLLKLRKWLKRL